MENFKNIKIKYMTKIAYMLQIKSLTLKYHNVLNCLREKQIYLLSLDFDHLYIQVKMLRVIKIKNGNR